MGLFDNSPLAGLLTGYLPTSGQALLDRGLDNANQGNQAILRGAQATLKKMRGQDLAPEEQAAIDDSPIGGMGTGTVGAGGAFAGTFAGRLARVPNKRQLSSAMRAAAKGMGADEIRARYGWFQAPDGDWKFEIPDNNVKLTPTPDPTLPAFLSEGYRLEHPELMRAYPELKQYRIGTHSRDENMAEAFHDPGAKYISLASDLPPDEALKSLIHELQHGVQTIEGFNPGASPWNPVVKEIAGERFHRIYSDAHSASQEFNNTLNDWFNERRGGWTGQSPLTMRGAAEMRRQFEREHPELTRRFEEALKVLDNPSKYLNEQKFQTYQRALGETEARDASERLNLTPEQRATITPYHLGRVREVRTPFDPADDIDLRAYMAAQPKKAADVPPETLTGLLGRRFPGLLTPEQGGMALSLLGMPLLPKQAE
jgi:hypothetical protein